MGSLMYAQVCTRFDNAFVVGVLGRCLNDLRMKHWKAVKHVMRYLKRTKGNMSTYWKSKILEIIGYSNSDFARCQDEFVACFEASNHGIWLRNFVTSLQVVDGIKRPLKIYCDNNSTVLYSNNNKSSMKLKFIESKRVQNKQISIEYIRTIFMLIDPLTKGLIPKVFYEHTAH
ncbi:Copia protein, partial [Mucuna pruriens]